METKMSVVRVCFIGLLYWSLYLLTDGATITSTYTMSSTTAAYSVIQGPFSENVTIGSIVTFECIHPNDLTMTWKVNELVLNESRLLPGYVISFSQSYVIGVGFCHTLTVEASLESNDTIFTCIFNGEESMQALLMVQGWLSIEETDAGPLDAPKDLNSSRDYDTNTTIITWTPPPSLDLTGVESDIVYCIEVVNITCEGGGEVLVSECGITEPIYQSRDIPLHYIYNITVTPRSNVEDAMNGTAAILEEKFPILSEIISASIRPEIYIDIQVTLDLDTTSHFNKPLPSFYSLLLTPVNTDNWILKPTLEMKRLNDSIVLDVINGLEEKLLLNCIVVAYTCGLNPLTNEFVLSTHHVQNVFVSSPNAGEISVNGDFLVASTATGLLVIVYNTSTSVRYHLYSRIPSENHFRAIIDNLEGGSYHVSVFTVENGIPFRQAATRPLSVYVPSVKSRTDNIVQPTVLITYTLQSTSTGVCITCTLSFLESSTTDCVAVVHQRISQLNSSGLMNIESSHKFTRSGNTASGCIEGVNLEDYQVGVIGGTPMMVSPINKAKESCFKSTLWCPVGVGIGIFVPLCLLLASIIICFISVSCLAKKRSNNVYQEHEFGVNMIPCPAYEVTSLRKEKIVMEKNPIYAIRSE